jgi:hypothetical protein
LLLAALSMCWLLVAVEPVVITPPLATSTLVAGVPVE